MPRSSKRNAAGFQFCGGTLVTPTKVVTAAHCSDYADDRKLMRNAPVYIGLGDHEALPPGERRPCRAHLRNADPLEIVE